MSHLPLGRIQRSQQEGGPPGVTSWALGQEAGNFLPWLHPKCSMILESLVFSGLQ